MRLSDFMYIFIFNMTFVASYRRHQLRNISAVWCPGSTSSNILLLRCGVVFLRKDLVPVQELLDFLDFDLISTGTGSERAVTTERLTNL